MLGYHRVDDGGHPLAIRRSTFSAQMAFLAGRRDRLPVIELAAAREAIPGRAVVLTFDDGWADNHASALPVLAELRLPATIYVPSRLLGTPGYLDRRQLLEMAAEGVTVGAHTRTHCDLRACGDRRLESEVRGSREDLEDLLGQPVVSFAYPAGHHDDRVVAAVAAAGYRHAVTTRRGWMRPATAALRIPRHFSEEFPLSTFAAALNGGLNLLAVADRLRREPVARP